MKLSSAGPGGSRRFQYVGVIPRPWVQLNFSYGNSTVAATMILAARQLVDASGKHLEDIVTAAKGATVKAAPLPVSSARSGGR